MKRFYCTVCKKVKRVQKWPAILTMGSDAGPVDVNPEDRIGECNWHKQGHVKPIKRIQVREKVTKSAPVNVGRNRQRKSA